MMGKNGGITTLAIRVANVLSPDDQLPVIVIHSEPRRPLEETKAEYLEAKRKQSRINAFAAIGYAHLMIWQSAFCLR